MSPNAWLEMNTRDAQALRLRPHDSVDVISRRGRVRNVELRVTEIVAPGQVFMQKTALSPSLRLAYDLITFPLCSQRMYLCVSALIPQIVNIFETLGPIFKFIFV